jgi:hypothetical protein
MRKERKAQNFQPDEQSTWKRIPSKKNYSNNNKCKIISKESKHTRNTIKHHDDNKK